MTKTSAQFAKRVWKTPRTPMFPNFQRRVLKKINKSSQERGCDDVVARPNQRVHKKCRSSWTNDKAITQALKRSSESSSPVKKKSRRISLGPYDPKKDCLFCGREISKGIHGHDESAGEILIDYVSLR